MTVGSVLNAFLSYAVYLVIPIYVHIFTLENHRDTVNDYNFYAAIFGGLYISGRIVFGVLSSIAIDRYRDSMMKLLFMSSFVTTLIMIPMYWTLKLYVTNGLVFCCGALDSTNSIFIERIGESYGEYHGKLLESQVVKSVSDSSGDETKMAKTIEQEKIEFYLMVGPEIGGFLGLTSGGFLAVLSDYENIFILCGSLYVIYLLRLFTLLDVFSKNQYFTTNRSLGDQSGESPPRKIETSSSSDFMEPNVVQKKQKAKDAVKNSSDTVIQTSAFKFLIDEIHRISNDIRLILTTACLICYGCSWTAYLLLAVTRLERGGGGYSVAVWTITVAIIFIGRVLGTLFVKCFKMLRPPYRREKLFISACIMVILGGCVSIPIDSTQTSEYVKRGILNLVTGIFSSVAMDMIMHAFKQIINDEYKREELGGTIAIKRISVWIGMIIGPFIGSLYYTVTSDAFLSTIFTGTPLLIVSCLLILIVPDKPLSQNYNIIGTEAQLS